ncbi:MAG: CapA family protein [Clostridia bacterium]|nr:CapA family protein [Clostridia bacterium]
MSNKRNQKGLVIGKYRITPLGLITLVVLILLIAAAVVVFVIKPFGGEDEKLPAPPKDPVQSEVKNEDKNESTPEPTAEPDAVEITAEPVATAVPVLRSATIRSLGEIAMENNLLKAAYSGESFDFSNMFSEISHVMGDADYTIADVEGSLGDTTTYSGKAKQMITPSSLITALKDCGVDMLMMANDHQLDGGFSEQQASVKNVADQGLAYVGAASSDAEKEIPVVKNINGINVGFVGYTTSLNGYEKYAGYGVNLVSKSNAAKDIQAAKDAGADVVIAYVSWGEMFERSVDSTQKKIAQALVKAGADVIIGYNPHVIQPASWIEAADADGNTRRALCLGATGNFLSDQRKKYTDSGIIFEFTIQEKSDYSGFEIVSPVYIPTYVWRDANEDGSYSYRTLAVGEWLETEPEGMEYSDVTRMREVWAEAQSILGIMSPLFPPTDLSNSII